MEHKPSSSKNSQFDLEVLKRKLASGRDQTLTVVSDSMSPLILVGEEIHITAINEEIGLKIFDIILFYQGGRLNTHFLTKIDKIEDQFITRSLKISGDQDYPLKRSEIIGKIKNKKLSFWHKLKVLLLS